MEAELACDPVGKGKVGDHPATFAITTHLYMHINGKGGGKKNFLDVAVGF